jgi:UDP-glucose 4-epimerase
MRCFVTGGAGFVGSHLVERLLGAGHRVTVYDNLSTGSLAHLEAARRDPGFSFVQADLLDRPRLDAAISGADLVFHLAANADVRRGFEQPGRDLEQNTVATFHLLEAMRAGGVPGIVFASTGSIYGEPQVFPTPEDAPFPVQTSLYAASKLAGEALITAYCTGAGMQAWIFRFVSLLGERYSHGHVVDFYRQLRADPTRLRVLGDGRQRKAYLYVGDCVEGIMLAVERARARVNIFNVGPDATCTVDESIAVICAALGCSPRLEHGGGERGWPGDSPRIHLDASRLRALGWRPTLSIAESLGRTLAWLRREEAAA